MDETDGPEITSPADIYTIMKESAISELKRITQLSTRKRILIDLLNPGFFTEDTNGLLQFDPEKFDPANFPLLMEDVIDYLGSEGGKKLQEDLGERFPDFQQSVAAVHGLMGQLVQDGTFNGAVLDSFNNLNTFRSGIGSRDFMKILRRKYIIQDELSKLPFGKSMFFFLPEPNQGGTNAVVIQSEETNLLFCALQSCQYASRAQQGASGNTDFAKSALFWKSTYGKLAAKRTPMAAQ